MHLGAFCSEGLQPCLGWYFVLMSGWLSLVQVWSLVTVEGESDAARGWSSLQFRCSVESEREGERSSCTVADGCSLETRPRQPFGACLSVGRRCAGCSVAWTTVLGWPALLSLLSDLWLL